LTVDANPEQQQQQAEVHSVHVAGERNRQENRLPNLKPNKLLARIC
jgi:hypothetical protein